MKPVLHLGDTSASKFIDAAARGAGPRATLTDAGFVAEVTGKAGDRDLGRLATSDSAKDRALLHESVAQTGAIVANMKSFENENLKDGPTGRVLRAAFKTGVPVMMENASAQRMSELTALGLGYEAVIIEPTGDGSDFHFTCLGEPSGSAPPLPEASKEDEERAKTKSYKVTDPEVLAKLEKRFGDGKMNNALYKKLTGVKANVPKRRPAPEFSDPRQVAEKFQHILQARPYATQKLRDQNRLGLFGESAGDKIGGIVTATNVQWGPFTATNDATSKDDYISIGMTFSWLLVRGRSDGPDGKYLQIKPSSPIINPSPMAYDETGARGYFTEAMKLKIWHWTGEPEAGGLTLCEHAPTNMNGETTYLYSTGFTAGSEGASINASAAQYVTIKDFTIVDKTQPNWAEWDIRLSMTNGGEDPRGMLNWWGDVKELPALAKNNFDLRADAVFYCEPSFTGQLWFGIGLEYWAKLAHYVHTYNDDPYTENPESYWVYRAEPQYGWFYDYVNVNYGAFSGYRW